jgi:hypothetical protein
MFSRSNTLAYNGGSVNYVRKSFATLVTGNPYEAVSEISCYFLSSPKRNWKNVGAYSQHYMESDCIHNTSFYLETYEWVQ